MPSFAFLKHPVSFFLSLMYCRSLYPSHSTNLGMLRHAKLSKIKKLGIRDNNLIRIFTFDFSNISLDFIVYCLEKMSYILIFKCSVNFEMEYSNIMRTD